MTSKIRKPARLTEAEWKRLAKLVKRGLKRGDFTHKGPGNGFSEWLRWIVAQEEQKR